MDARYGTEAEAKAYREKYERSFLRRWSSRRELKLVYKALAQASASGRFLDCPCGAGRLGPVLLRRAVRLVCADLSGPMLHEAQSALEQPARAGRVGFVRAVAEGLPFAKGAFDVAVCHRLLHHVADPARRGRLFSEMARVAGRWVVLSFHDAATMKRRLRGSRPRSRIALTPAELEKEAARAGLILVPPVRRVNGWFSLMAVALFRVEPR